MTGTLVSDAEEVARLVRALLGSGLPDRMVGMQIADGHEVTADDMRHIDRRVIRLTAPGQRVGGVAPTTHIAKNCEPPP